MEFLYSTKKWNVYYKNSFPKIKNLPKKGDNLLLSKYVINKDKYLYLDNLKTFKYIFS